MNKFVKFFTIEGEEDYETQEWCLEEKQSTENKLVYYGYDANFMPMINLSKTSKENQNKVIGTAWNILKDFKGEVWLDDVKIKEVQNESN